MYILRDNREDGLKLSVVVWVKSKSQKSWLKQENSRLLTDETKNLSSPRNSDLLTKKCKYLIFHRNYNALINYFHQTRHISDYVTSLSFSLPQIESRRLFTLWHHSDWRFLLLQQSTSKLTCNGVRHGNHCQSIYGYNSTRALIGGWARIMKIFSARQLVWVLSKSHELVGENNGKDGQSWTIFSITERKTSQRILLKYERRREP